MPLDRTRYPPDWEAISHRIRFGRALGYCEGYRLWEISGDPHFVCSARHNRPHPLHGRPTSLAVAHLDHNPANNAETNLVALCRPCHNRYDAAHRGRSHRYGRRHREHQLGLGF